MRTISLAALLAFGAAHLAFAPSARADEVHGDVEPTPGPKRPDKLSIGLYSGFRPDMAALGATLVKDGVVELSPSNALRAFGGTKYFLMSDKDDDIAYYGSATTASPWKFLKERKSSGPLTGLTLGLDVRYELHEQGLPLYVRAGFDYTFRVLGGTHERVLGGAMDYATPFGAAMREATGGTEGGRLTTRANSSWVEIPVSVGFALPLRGGHKIYAGVGASYFNGNFSIEFDADEKYMAAASTFTDGTRILGPLSRRAIKTRVQFDYASVGPNFTIGAEARLADRSAVFLEFAGSGVSGTVYSNDLGPEGSEALTILNSGVAGNGVVLPHKDDPKLFKRFAFPVVLGGAYFRFGYRFYVL